MKPGDLVSLQWMPDTVGLVREVKTYAHRASNVYVQWQTRESHLESRWFDEADLTRAVKDT